MNVAFFISGCLSTPLQTQEVSWIYQSKNKHEIYAIQITTVMVTIKLSFKCRTLLQSWRLVNLWKKIKKSKTNMVEIDLSI